MDYILKSRGRGKTYDLIQRSARTGERIICPSGVIASCINKKAKDMGLTIPEARPYTYLMKNGYDHNGEKVLIDELEWFLGQILPCEVSAVTDTPDDVVIDTRDLSNSPDFYRDYSSK